MIHLNWNLIKMMGMVFMFILGFILSDKMVISSEPDQISKENCKENYMIAFLLFLIEATICVLIFTIE